ncbi:MAG: flippase [Microgenomates group bacterium]
MLKKPIINTLVQILGKAGMVGISLLTTGVLTRKLGVQNYGNFILISSLFVFLDSLADFGTKTIGVREISKENGEKVGEHVFTLRMLMTTISFVVGVMVIWSWKGLETIRIESTVALLMIFLTSLAGFWEIIFQSKLRMDLKVLMDLSFPITFLVWLWWWQGSVSLLMVMMAYLIARGISLWIGYYLVSGLSSVTIGKIDGAEIKKMWQMTWPMGVFLIMFATYDRAIDSLLIQNYLGSSEVAWYGLAYKVYGALLAPAYFYVNSIFPIMGAKETNKRKLFGESVIILGVSAILLIIGVYFMAPYIIQVLGGVAFEPSIAVLRILVVAALFSYMGHLVGFTLISEGGQKEMLKLGMVALIVNLGLNMWLIPHYGILAAAGVTVVTEMIDCLMMGYFLVNKIKRQNPSVS